MSWHPNDLITDLDLLAYESTLLTTFNRTEWDEKRGKALEDWLWPILRANGYDTEKFRTRYQPDQVWGYTGAAYSDKTDAATDETSDDLNLATIFATPASDAILVGSVKAFRGLSWRMLDAVSSVAGSVSVEYWADRWTQIPIADDTTIEGDIFARGGAMIWRVPSDWTKRVVSSGDPLYYVRVKVTATPTAAKAGQLGTIRRSALCAPAAYRTLALIMREAPTSADGPWREKAAWYEAEANASLERALQIVAGEFDTDEDDQIDPDEEDQTNAEIANGTFRMERA